MVVRDYFPAGINMYVPAAKYSADLNLFGVNWVSLGSPAAESATAVINAQAANATALTEHASTFVSVAEYGQALKLAFSGDPGAAGTYDVYGYDYLGQLMIERVVAGGGGNVIWYLQKAFKSVYKVVVVAAASNAVTYSVGTLSRLGLPYKGFVTAARESGIWVPVFNVAEWHYVDIAAAGAVAGQSRYIRAPFDGFVKSLKTLADGGGSTNDPVVTVELATVAITGLTATVDVSAAGNEVTDVPTTAGYRANNRFVAGGLIEIVSAAAASATGFRVGLELQPIQYSDPVLTDPATAITGDPRGLYTPIQTLNGGEIEVGLLPDNYVNASGNGGLFGIRHFGG